MQWPAYWWGGSILPVTSAGREYGMEAGKVFPASEATSLLNPLRRLVQSPRRTIKAMRLALADRVLELGSGPGYFSPEIAAAIPVGRLVLFDLQSRMLQLAGERLSAFPRCGYVQGDGTALPFADDSFDAVFIAVVLGEIGDRDTALDEISRVVRPSGALTVCETRRDSDFIPLPRLRDLLAPHGFEFVDRRGNPLQYTARFTNRD